MRLRRLEILASKVKPFLQLWRKAPLDLYGPGSLALRGQQKIDLGASRCAVDVGGGSLR